MRSEFFRIFCICQTIIQIFDNTISITKTKNENTFFYYNEKMDCRSFYINRSLFVASVIACKNTPAE